MAGSLGGLSTSPMRSPEGGKSGEHSPAANNAFASFQKVLRDAESVTKITPSEHAQTQRELDQKKRSKRVGNVPSGANDSDEPPLHKTIASLQKLLGVAYEEDQDLAESLREMGQEKIDTLKKQGYEVKDLKLPSDDE